MDGSSGNKKSTQEQTHRILDDVAESIVFAAARLARLEMHLGRTASPELRERITGFFVLLRGICNDVRPEKSTGQMADLYEALRAEQLVPCPECGDEGACSCAADARAAQAEEAAGDEERAS